MLVALDEGNSEFMHPALALRGTGACEGDTACLLSS